MCASLWCVYVSLFVTVVTVCLSVILCPSVYVLFSSFLEVFLAVSRWSFSAATVKAYYDAKHNELGTCFSILLSFFFLFFFFFFGGAVGDGG